MKKSVIFLILVFCLMSTNFTSLVSAYNFSPNDLYGTGQSIIQAGSDMISPFLEFLIGTTSTDSFFFSKVLVLLLLFIIIFTVLRKIDLFRDRKNISFIVAAIISILAIRFIPQNEFFEAILIPYGTLGIAILIFLPFLIYFWFVETTVAGTMGRRLAWLVYGLVFLFLWLTRTPSILNEMNYLYAAGLICILLAIIFDPAIKRYFNLGELRRSERAINDAETVRLLNDYQRALDVYHRTRNESARREVERLERQLNRSVGRGENTGGGI